MGQVNLKSKHKTVTLQDGRILEFREVNNEGVVRFTLDHRFVRHITWGQVESTIESYKA